MADLPDDKFVDFIKEELRRSKLHRVKYFKAIKIQPELNYVMTDKELIDKTNETISELAR